MAKQGMKRPEPERKKNPLPPVPEISGDVQRGQEEAVSRFPGDDLAFENRLNDLDMTAADLQDFWRKW